ERLRPYRQIAYHAGDFSAFPRKDGAAVLDWDLTIVQETARRRIAWFDGDIRQSFADSGHAGTCCSDDAKDVAFNASKENVRSIKHSGSRVGDCVESPLAVLGCAGDDAKDIGRRGLAVEAFTQFVEQPCILNRDDGLGGKVLH